MRRAFTSSLVVVAMLLIAIGCSSGGDLKKSETQRDFGVRMAKMNLWREAMFRFNRAVQIAPADAQAHNNLAVALEANGDFEAAAREYREALRLDRTNQHIQKNYSRFIEFTQRSKKREATAKTLTGTAVTTTAATTTAATTTTGTPPAPPTSTVAPPPTDTAATTTNPPQGGN
jgi:Tfp pilus assembly protein PilF